MERKVTKYYLEDLAGDYDPLAWPAPFYGIMDLIRLPGLIVLATFNSLVFAVANRLGS